VPESQAVRALADERDHLLRSIEDLDRELGAGEVDEDDYRTLRAEYVSRAAAVLREIEAASAAGDGGEGEARIGAGGGDDRAATRGPGSGLRRRLGRRGVRLWLGCGLAVCLTGLVVLFALRVAGVRLPGETSSGSITLNPSQQVQAELTQAQQLGAAGDIQAALTLYQDVLAADPHQPVALAYRGWLMRLTGLETTPASAGKELVTAGRSSIEEALSADPGYGDAHLFLGLSLLEDAHELPPAITQFRLAVADHASASLLQASAPVIRQAFETAHAPVPAGVPSS
jgi:hypothetical protein